MPADRAGITFRAMGTDAQIIVIGGPAGLERHARDRIAQLEQRWSRFVDNSEISTLMKEPDMTKRLVELGGEPRVQTPEAFGEEIKAETEKWKKVVEFAGLKVE